MARPRQIFKGSTYLITRRCTQRHFLTRPSEEINEILLFCMIRAANQYGIQIHAFSFLSNHYHIILTDPLGKLPLFEASLNKFSAKCINFIYRRWENLWAVGSYGAVWLRGSEDMTAREDIIDKLIYTLANPVEAGLVDRGYKWPGAWSTPSLMSSGYIEAKRPAFFEEDGSIPEKVRMSLTKPPGFPNTTPKEFSKQIAKRLNEKEEEIQARFEAQGRKFMGPKRIKAQNPESKPNTPTPRRKLNPSLACRDKWKRIELLRRVKEFLIDHRQAWLLFCAGQKDVVFPAGTYKMRVFYNVKCEVRSQTFPIPT